MSFLKRLFGKGDTPVEKAKILLEENSPNCPLIAVVEQDNRVAYLYLWGAEESSFGMKSCWIRNFKYAPEDVENEIIEEGHQPMMPKANCKYPEGQPPLQLPNIEFVWLEEGEGVALLDQGEVLAVIPSWGGQGGFHGYARDCQGHGPFAWELNVDNSIQERISRSKAFWDSWNTEETPWHRYQPELLDCYTERFGKYDKYFAIDKNQWPPKGLYYKKNDALRIFITVGVSLRSQPMVEMYSDAPNTLNRIELGFITSSKLHESELDRMVHWISGQTNLPWGQITWLGEGHTIHCDVFEDKKYDAMLLTTKLSVLPKMLLPEIYGSPINLLWMIPITEHEKDYVVEQGSQSLIDKLNALGDVVFALDRKQLKV